MNTLKQLVEKAVCGEMWYLNIMMKAASLPTPQERLEYMNQFVDNDKEQEGLEDEG